MKIRLSRSTVSIQPKPPSHRDIIGPSTYFRRSGICSICSPKAARTGCRSTLIDFGAYRWRAGVQPGRIKPLWKRLDSLRKNTLSDLQGLKPLKETLILCRA